MSKYNYTENCIKGFMQQLEMSQQTLKSHSTDGFKAGFNHAFDLAQIWFKDLIVEAKEEETEAQS